MKAFVFGLGMAALLAGCGAQGPFGPPTGSDRATGKPAGQAAPRVPVCEGRSSPNCRFRNSPVKLEQTPVRLPRRALMTRLEAEIEVASDDLLAEARGRAPAGS